MITDEMISTAAEEANQTLLDSLPCSDTFKHKFSDKFEKKIKHQISKANHPKIYRFLKQVAGFLLVLFLGGAALLTLSSEARAAFVGWIKEQYETLFLYQFSGETLNPDGLKSYGLGFIPEGYSEIDKQHSELDGFVICMNENGDILQFVYSGDYENVAMYINNIDYEKTKITVNGYEADLYLSNNPDSSHAIIWIDTKQNIAFLISGFFGSDTLINLAENIIEQN